jgi:hypothetical protein
VSVPDRLSLLARLSVPDRFSSSPMVLSPSGRESCWMDPDYRWLFGSESRRGGLALHRSREKFTDNRPPPGGPFEPFRRFEGHIATRIVLPGFSTTHRALFGVGARLRLQAQSMVVDPESVLITCRCGAWPMAIRTRSYPRQGILPTVLICSRCSHEINGPRIHDEQHRAGGPEPGVGGGAGL